MTEQPRPPREDHADIHAGIHMSINGVAADLRNSG
jgi:phosphoenolpyruvate carboxylase